MKAKVELPGLQGEVIREIEARLVLGVEVTTEAEGRFLFSGSAANIQTLFSEAVSHSIAPASCGISPVSCPGSIWS